MFISHIREVKKLIKQLELEIEFLEKEKLVNGSDSSSIEAIIEIIKFKIASIKKHRNIMFLQLFCLLMFCTSVIILTVDLFVEKDMLIYALVINSIAYMIMIPITKKMLKVAFWFLLIYTFITIVINM